MRDRDNWDNSNAAFPTYPTSSLLLLIGLRLFGGDFAIVLFILLLVDRVALVVGREITSTMTKVIVGQGVPLLVCVEFPGCHCSPLCSQWCCCHRSRWAVDGIPLLPLLVGSVALLLSLLLCRFWW